MVTSIFPVTRGFSNFDRTFDKLVRDAFAPVRAANSALSQPVPVDIYANDNQAVITAALPGVQPADLDVKVHQNQITISGKVANTSAADDAKGATWLAKELWSGEFRRSMTLPFAIDPDAVQASFELGVLRIVLPKAESAKPRTISIASAAPAAQSIAETSESEPEATAAE